MTYLTQIGVDEIDDIAVGAGILGTGGGGDPFLGALMAKQAVDQFGPVTLLQASDIDADAMVVPISMMGAPSISVEKFPSLQQIDRAIEALETRLNLPIKAVFPIEIGGSNAMLPIVAAARLGLPLIDCDAMGRAFPESQMVTFYLDGLPSAPNVLVDERGNVAVLEPIDGIWAEKFARPIVDQMGGSALILDYPMAARDCLRSALHGTVSQARALGKVIRQAYQGKQNPVDMCLDFLGGYWLMDGKVVDVDRSTSGGFTCGSLQIQSLPGVTPRRLKVHFQNEFLLVNDDDQETAIAMTPDLICVLDTATGQAITTENLNYGQRVTLIAVPCHQKWRSEKGLSVVGPNSFGYAIDYQPIETLARAAR